MNKVSCMIVLISQFTLGCKNETETPPPKDTRSWILKSGHHRNTIAKKTSKEECEKRRQHAFESGWITEQERKDLETVNGEPECDEDDGVMHSWEPCED